MSSPKIQAVIFDWIGTLYERGTGLFPEAKTVLSALKRKYSLGLVTMAPSDINQRSREIEGSLIREYFNSLIITSQKNPASYSRCIRELGSTPQTTAIVDDRTVRGIMLGNQLGCQTYWLQKGEYARQLPNEQTGQPTHTINSLTELLSLL